MYAKGKGSSVPSDAQAREKLALYVYEYLLHVGAQKAAQTFLSEIRWEKNISLGEPPGFLHSWWCVFWDLYCAAPERRETCEHSSEAKAFHDYGFVNSGYGVNGIAHNTGPAPSPLGQMPPTDGMPGGPIPPGFFPNSTLRPSPPTHPSSQPSPHSQPPPPHSNIMTSQPFMNPRYPAGPRPGVRMPQIGSDFNGPPGQPLMPNNMDPTRQGDGGEFVGWQGPPAAMNRMNPPRGPSMGPLGPGTYGPGIRGPPPNSSLGPGGPMPPMTMGGPGGRPQWQPNTSTMGGGPDAGGPMGPMGPNSMGPVMNGDGMDGMKNSPANGGPGTPREDSGSGMGDYNLGGFGGPGENDQTESAAILKIKESMQEEAKRFEKDSDHPEYFMQ
ncbi:single-stranded DNA-binding protein 3 isoform X4 [Cylas formicarius]|uniref:single-stranded DNA-binding protein 3 isoform X4 n=1 Tax=Cylas formicarius TaxID=197179 RepID=UPI0029587E04|nr:single-stranded DNA-binding protein 3 isoform X4 [Cylas formicarius]